MIPVLVQAAVNSAPVLRSSCHDSSARVTHVPWHYYLDKLGHFDGYPLLVVWALGIVRRAAVQDGPGTGCCWSGCSCSACSSRPIRSRRSTTCFRDPGAVDSRSPRAVLRLRARFDRCAIRRHRRHPQRPAGAGLAALAPIAAAVAIGRGLDRAGDRRGPDRTPTSACARRRSGSTHNTPPDAGVMTLSKGSAQYALSFYANRDAYPFGRFRLATVFPGGKVRSPRPVPDGGPPATGSLLAAAPDQEPAGLVPRLLHGRGRRPARGPDRRVGAAEVVPELHRGLRRPAGPHRAPQSRRARVDLQGHEAAFAADDLASPGRGDHVVVKGEGFRFNSRVTVYYHRVRAGHVPDRRERLVVGSFPLSRAACSRKYWLVAVDNAGNVASRTGLSPPSGASASRRPQARRRPATGAGTPGGEVQRRPAPPRRDAEAPKQVPVGSALPVVVHVKNRAAVSSLVAQARRLARRSARGRARG